MGTMNDKIFQQSDFTLASVYGMVILDIFLYSFITWYLDQVLPTQYGQRQHPLFFLHKSHWFPDAAVPEQLSQKGSTKSNDRFEPSAEGKENAVEVAPLTLPIYPSPTGCPPHPCRRRPLIRRSITPCTLVHLPIGRSHMCELVSL
ncbi:hypothetical protein CYMTET_28934 [Cymbomonas tetramitiformis]|uniref:Uncharacterized protein n=1 Tax=Cymbomonas tetramitiformis TaxID=36881 RepID=A0AAE0FM48_9CHLO|nr:hypothetical protein CYMTET_28934 [Cymbomonas tetramitiformis]